MERIGGWKGKYVYVVTVPVSRSIFPQRPRPAFIRDQPLFMHVHVALAAVSFEFFFCTVYSSELESNIVALLLEHNGDQCSCKTRT